MVGLWHTVRVKSAEQTVANLRELTPFTVFAWLWAAATLSHMASYSEPLQVITVVLVVLAFAVLLGIYRTAAFFILLGAHLVYVYGKLPHVPNHSILAATIDVTILSAAVWTLVKKRSFVVDTTALYRIFAPVVRIELLVLYFFVVFHKLNTGFFDPEYSCAAFMYLRLAREYPALPVDTWARLFVIYSTMAIEAAIPIMLVVRRLRIAGLFLAFVFHFALAMDPGDVVFNFSAMLLALFFLFLPESFAGIVSAALLPLRRWWAEARLLSLSWLAGRSIAYVIAPALFAVLIFRTAIPTGLTYETSRRVWVAYSGFVLVAFVIALVRQRVTLESARQLLVVPAPVLLVFPLFLVFNGVLPYLGAKTETSFAMYSNLRTEGGVSNHWLMPASMQIWEYQRDLVTVRRTSVRAVQRIANRGFQWPYFEFRWMMRQHPDASVTYERNGMVRTVKRVADDPELMGTEGPMMRKLFKFRPVPIDWTRPRCVH